MKVLEYNGGGDTLLPIMKEMVANAIGEGETFVRFYSIAISRPDVIDIVVDHFKERLGDICKVGHAPQRKICGFPLRGVEVVVTDVADADLAVRRVRSMFDSKPRSYITLENVCREELDELADVLYGKLETYYQKAGVDGLREQAAESNDTDMAALVTCMRKLLMEAQEV